MRTSDPVRVFAMGSARAAPLELSLQVACAQAGLAIGAATLAPHQLPELAAALRRNGASAVLVRATVEGRPCHWLDARHACGWVAAAMAGDPDAMPTAWATQLADGHVPADAALLAWPTPPRLSWPDDPAPHDRDPAAGARTTDAPLGLYAIVDSATAVRRVLEAGVRTVQLRVKQPDDADDAWTAALRSTVGASLAAADAHGALLFINDHWRLAAEMGARAVHLGQEDLLALGPRGRAELRASGLRLGVSSHAVWELCRARSLDPLYIACGPVWPTTTKAMPWRPQGLDNLAWWCRVAGTPVVAIGGILTPDQVRVAAAAGASGVCVVRGLGSDPRSTVAPLQRAFEEGRREALDRVGEPVHRPHPTLEVEP